LITLLGAPSSQTFPYGIDFDDGGDFFVCGMTSGNLGDELHSGIRDMFVSRFSNSGVMKWTRLLGASGGDVWAKDICVDASGSIYVTGYTPNDLGDQVRIGSQDAFVVKYLPTGSREWIRLIGGTGGNASANGICCNKDDGTLTVAGCALKVFDGYPIPGLFSAGFLTTRFTP